MRILNDGDYRMAITVLAGFATVGAVLGAIAGWRAPNKRNISSSKRTDPTY